MCRGFESHPSSSFFFSEKKELFGLVALPFFLFIGLRVFMYVLVEHTSMKNELYQTNVKIKGFIYIIYIEPPSCIDLLMHIND